MRIAAQRQICALVERPESCFIHVQDILSVYQADYPDSILAINLRACIMFHMLAPPVAEVLTIIFTIIPAGALV